MTSDENSDGGVYQHAAQTAIEYHLLLKGGHNNRGSETALQTARKLYEEHGPFDLDWGAEDPRAWYR